VHVPVLSMRAASCVVGVYLDIDGGRHDKHGDHDVSDGQRDDEVVGDRVQGALDVDAQTDENVTEQSQCRQHQQRQCPVLQPVQYVLI